MAKRKPAENTEDDESPESKRRAREEFERQRAENDRVRDEARRHMFSFFKMWAICPDKRCIRTHSCAGDLEECLYARWRKVIPPEIKSLLQKTFALMRDGHSAHEAERLAKEDIERHRSAIAALEERQRVREFAPMASSSEAGSSPLPDVHRGPRIRFL